jgi:hypothetical protein
MRALFPSVAIVILAVAAGAAQADGLLYQLPKDGTWASYQFDLNAKMDGVELQAQGSLRLASVGQATDKDKPCRWIEAGFQVEMKGAGVPEPARKENLVVKVLIPEKHLREGASPLDHVVRGWIARNDRQPEKLTDPKDFETSPLPIMLAPPLKDAKKLEAVVVESKLGKLSCEGLTGSAKFDNQRGQAVDLTLESRLHPKAPFGVVSSRWTMKITGDGKPAGEMTWNLRLSDLGEDAKSELPDQQ